MGWQVKILGHPGDDANMPKPLGTCENVVKWISQVTDDLRWTVTPPLNEHPTLWRCADGNPGFLLPTNSATVVRDSLAVHFRTYGFPSDQIQTVHVDVTGAGHPLTILRRICLPKGWQLWDTIHNERIDLTLMECPQWALFSQYLELRERQTIAVLNPTVEDIVRLLNRMQESSGPDEATIKNAAQRSDIGALIFAKVKSTLDEREYLKVAFREARTWLLSLGGTVENGFVSCEFEGVPKNIMRSCLLDYNTHQLVITRLVMEFLQTRRRPEHFPWVDSDVAEGEGTGTRTNSPVY
jgi:hypothetical protein